MLLREVPNLLLDARDGAPPILGKLMENAEVLQETELSRGDFLGRLAAVKFAQQSANCFQAHGIGIATKETFPVANLRNKPDAGETAFDPVNLSA